MDVSSPNFKENTMPVLGAAASAASGVASAAANAQIAEQTNNALAAIQLHAEINKKGNDIMVQNAV